jgi:EAL domain-containing protein (putative c-di-GMP-specific phosphodiesterase class I)
MVSVNVPADRLGEADFVVQVEQAIGAAGIAPRHVCLEITERALIDDLPAAAERLEVLRQLGVSVAIDDFGTGHAGLSYLQGLPLDVIKIDRSFVMKVTAHPRSDSIIQAIVELAVALEATSVAEGIETPEQLAAVQRLGCPMVQGYLTGRPGDPASIEVLLRQPAVPVAALAQRR